MDTESSRALRIRTITSVREVEVVDLSTLIRQGADNSRNSAEKTAIVAAPAKAKKHINGVKLPVEEVRKRITRTSHNIAAIDFGTTSCSLAYCLKGDPTIHMLKLSADDNRVPSTILVDQNGTVTEFGKNARKKYVHLPREKKETHQFFSEIKMKLQHDKEVSLTNTVKSLSQQEFYLIEVIAVTLRYLKDRLLSMGELSRGLSGAMKATDFDWVITVPAMWKARGKQMMREAAYMAGIAHDNEKGISNLSLVTRSSRHLKSSHLKAEEKSRRPKDLFLALEPEAAALHCISQAKEMDNPIAKSSCYMVLDIGGGTVDITAHKVTDGCIEVVLPPQGNDWGGRRINEEFKQFLGIIVDDPEFSKYIKSENASGKSNEADLDGIINLQFEEQKQFFGEKGVCDDDALISLPYSFMKVYKGDLEKGIKRLSCPGVRLEGNELLISYQKMEDFFRQAIGEITACVSECVTKVNAKQKLESVFFVGGFGGSKYLHDKVKEVLDPDILTYCPIDHKTAVVRGAVLFRQNPDIIKSRVADATYGQSCITSFKPQLHDIEYLIRDDDDRKKCNHLFEPVIFEGDAIRADRVLVATSTPFQHLQTNMHFEIFTTMNRLLKYVKKSNGESIPEATQIGKLTVRMPDMRNDKDRKVKITFDFSHTEIHIEAYDITSGERAHTIVDFLSDLSS